MENQSYAEAVHNAYNHCVAELERKKARFLKNPEKDFSRERKLTFSSCVRFCVQAGSGALQNELLRHFSFAQATPTKSAFCQQRGKISSEAFACLFRDFTDCLERIDAPKTLKGYQILASDGSAVNLPYNPSDTETFHENGERRGYNQIHLNALYQMLDGYYFDCVLAPEGKTHERAALLEMLSRFPNTLKAILLMDRGFEGYDVLASLLLSGQKFVLRLKDVNSTGILSSWFLPDDREFDTEIQTILTTVQTRQTKADRETYTVLSSHTDFHFPDENYPFFPMKLRILRMEIAPGKFECVATNLPADEFSLQEIKELYYMRWGEETSFRDLKYTLDLLHFHAKKRQYVEQEIYAGLVRFNFCGAIAHHVDPPPSGKNETRKYDYKIRFVVAVCVCLEYMKRGPVSMNPCALITRFLTPVRPDRSFPRNIKSQSAKSFLYRPA